jgi:predicted lactoylglutathione lyase
VAFETSLFINLPVEDLDRTKAFFAALGFSFNPQFTDEKAACLVLGKTNFAMLLRKEFFGSFTGKDIIDARKSTELITAISVESRAKVDELAEAALRSGGSPSGSPSDLGFMYTRSFQDPDNHNWEVFWMDPTHVQ